ncbi:MAG: hypothetical protein AAGI38_16120 [Bacteroidota bacterium]
MESLIDTSWMLIETINERGGTIYPGAIAPGDYLSFNEEYIYNREFRFGAQQYPYKFVEDGIRVSNDEPIWKVVSFSAHTLEIEYLYAKFTFQRVISSAKQTSHGELLETLLNHKWRIISDSEEFFLPPPYSEIPYPTLFHLFLKDGFEEKDGELFKGYSILLNISYHNNWMELPSSAAGMAAWNLIQEEGAFILSISRWISGLEVKNLYEHFQLVVNESHQLTFSGKYRLELIKM